jgi:hypothetical protein
MARDAREWTVPAPLRALMWWPATAFVLVMVAPEAAVTSIAAAGAALVALGAVTPVVGRRLRRAAVAGSAVGGAVVEPPAQDPPTIEIEMPTIEMPPTRRVA